MHHSGLRAQLRHRGDQSPISVQPEQSEVEIPVGLDERGEIDLVGVRRDLVGERTPASHHLDRDGAGQGAHRWRFQQRAKLDDLPKVLLAQLDDAETLVPHGFNEAALLKIEHRLTNGGR